MTNVREAKDRVKTLLEGNPGLRGVGITWRDGRERVLVNVAAGAAPAVRQLLRARLPDVDIVVQTVGNIFME
jgi:hypothetical protein